MRFYRLEDHAPVLEPDLVKWAQWYATADVRIAQTFLHPDTELWTMFLGVDHDWRGNGPPLLFETLMFWSWGPEIFWRYATWEDAVRCHHEQCERLRKNIDLWIATQRGEPVPEQSSWRFDRHEQRLVLKTLLEQWREERGDTALTCTVGELLLWAHVRDFSLGVS
jgi:hypothetical protein